MKRIWNGAKRVFGVWMVMFVVEGLLYLAASYHAHHWMTVIGVNGEFPVHAFDWLLGSVGQ